MCSLSYDGNDGEWNCVGDDVMMAADDDVVVDEAKRLVWRHYWNWPILKWADVVVAVVRLVPQDCVNCGDDDGCGDGKPPMSGCCCW